MFSSTQVYDDDGCYEGIIDGRYVEDYRYEVVRMVDHIAKDTEDGPCEEHFTSYAVLQNRQVVVSWVHKDYTPGGLILYSGVHGYYGRQTYDKLEDAIKYVEARLGEALPEYKRENTN